MEQLRLVGAEVLGIVLNDADKNGRYGNRGSYYYDYYGTEEPSSRWRRLVPFV